MTAPRRIFGVGALAVAAVLALGACGSSSKSTAPAATTASSSSAASTKAPVNIGVVGTFSGFAGVTSKSDEAGIQAWASATNAAGGLDGHPVHVFVEDDQGSASLSLASVKKLVENDHVIAIVSSWESGLEATWASYVDGKKIPVIGGEATGGQWVTDANFFASQAGPVNGLILAANTAKLGGYKAYALAACAEVPACAQGPVISKQVSASIGVNYVGSASLLGSATDYTAQCLSLKSKGADLVFLATAQATGKRFLQNCAVQNFKPTPFEYAGTFTKALLSDPTFEGMYLMSPSFSWLGTTPGVAAFNAGMAKYQPAAEINGAAVTGWSGGILLKAAATSLSSTPTSADLYKGLYALGPNFTADGLIPPVTFTAGKPAVQKPCAWYLRITSGKLTSPQGTEQVCVGS